MATSPNNSTYAFANGVKTPEIKHEHLKRSQKRQRSIAHSSVLKNCGKVPHKGRWIKSKRELELQSPSTADGFSLHLQLYIRLSVFEYCRQLGFILHMNLSTIASAFILWQRFFMYHSFGDCDPYQIVTVCLFLAGKSEENYRSVSSISEQSFLLRYSRNKAAMRDFEGNKKAVIESENKRLLEAELLVLCFLNYDLDPENPVVALFKILKHLKIGPEGGEKYASLYKLSLTLASESVKTTLCLQPFSPAEVAVICLRKAAEILKFEIPDEENGKPWWSGYVTSKKNLIEIAKQMKPLYWVMKESEKETSEGNGGGNGDGDEISPTKSPQDPSANPLPHFPDDVAPSHLPEMEMEPPQEKETEERRGESSLQENLPSQETSEIMGSNVGDKKVPLPEEEQSEKMEEDSPMEKEGQVVPTERKGALKRSRDSENEENSPEEKRNTGKRVRFQDELAEGEEEEPPEEGKPESSPN